MRGVSGTFAAMTAVAARRAMNTPPTIARLTRQALYSCSEAVGRVVRLLLRPGVGEDTLRAFRMVYRLAGVDARFHDSRMVVRRCLYACAFDGAVCRYMCAFDDGLFAGVTGGGRLLFTTRTTEGARECTAAVALPSASAAGAGHPERCRRARAAVALPSLPASATPGAPTPTEIRA